MAARATALVLRHLTKVLIEAMNAVGALPDADLTSDTAFRIAFNREISIGLADRFEEHSGLHGFMTQLKW
jgi:hypothetical protein